jgi:acyl-CoA thioesterase
MNEESQQPQNEQIEEEIQDSLKSDENYYLQTHTKINRYLCGDITVLKKGYVEVILEATEEMLADEMGLVHGGFIFGAADFAAMAAVNEKNVVLVATNCQFLAPAKFQDTIKFIARVRHQEGRKRNVKVEAFCLGIKIFEGEFMTVITEKHVLKMKLYNEKEHKR